jgi:hypothetical protein
VRICDLATRRQLAVLRGEGPQYAVTYHPGGRRIAALGHSISVWDAESGRLLERRPVSRQLRSGSLGYSPDGSLLMVTTDYWVDLYDAATGEKKSRWARDRRRDHPTLKRGLFHRAAFSPDGRLVAHGGDRGELLIRRVRDGTILHRLRGHERALSAVRFSPDGRWLASCGHAGKTLVWEVETGRRRLALEGHIGMVFDAAFSPDQACIATGGDDALIHIWDTATGDLRMTLRGHRRYVYSIRFSPDGETLLSGSGDNTVRLWTTRPARRRYLEKRALLEAERRVAPQVAAAIAGGAEALPANLRTRAARNVWLRRKAADHE